MLLTDTVCDGDVISALSLTQCQLRFYPTEYVIGMLSKACSHTVSVAVFPGKICDRDVMSGLSNTQCHWRFCQTQYVIGMLSQHYPPPPQHTHTVSVAVLPDRVSDRDVIPGLPYTQCQWRFLPGTVCDRDVISAPLPTHTNTVSVAVLPDRVCDRGVIPGLPYTQCQWRFYQAQYVIGMLSQA